MKPVSNHSTLVALALAWSLAACTAVHAGELGVQEEQPTLNELLDVVGLNPTDWPSVSLSRHLRTSAGNQIVYLTGATAPVFVPPGLCMRMSWIWEFELTAEQLPKFAGSEGNLQAYEASHSCDTLVDTEFVGVIGLVDANDILGMLRLGNALARWDGHQFLGSIDCEAVNESALPFRVGSEAGRLTSIERLGDDDTLLRFMFPSQRTRGTAVISDASSGCRVALSASHF